MKWMSIRIKTTTEAEDLIIGSLYLRGLEGAQIEDHIPLTPLEKEQMFVDILPETQADDGTAYLTFYVEMEPDGRVLLSGEPYTSDEVRAMIEEELDELSCFDMDLGYLTISIDETEDIDWINNWKKYFHQFTIDDLLVIPSWESVAPEDAEKKILHIDPGTAFGTGMHETTQLCIREMKKHITPDTRLLDIGTGSGILGIIALMYGAGSVRATDLDPCAVPAVDDNLTNNHIDKSLFELKIGNIIDDREVQDWAGYDTYDVVMANILADVLVPLMPAAVRACRRGGVIITSGIIEGKEDMVADAMRKCGLTVESIASQGEWRSVTGRKA
ncbi:MAG: 50S ribosomal protein L11 methyltransferase [Lachnospiraceae bacterium]|nr:50S ribosomal protein L11 methyltransferase [Lachnospiraceae bacterium]